MESLSFYLKKLISFKTLTSDKTANRRALDFVKKEVSGLPVFVRGFSSDGFPSLLITTKNTKRPKILLAGHIDVVGGSNRVFKPLEENGKIIGRGVYDMNFAAACYIRLLKDLGTKLSQYDFGVLLTCDEELGGQNGTKAILQKGVRAKFCVIPDGGKDWTFQNSAKGVLNVLVKSIGKPGHGSRPWEGENAIEKLTEALVKIKKEFSKENNRSKENRVTLNTGKIQGGEELNKIPELATAELDIRFPVFINKQSVIRRLKRVTRNIKNLNLTERQSVDGYKVDRSNKFFQLFIGLVEKKLKRKVKFIDSFGSCDARYFIKAGIPVVSLRPIGGGHHTEKEWIDLKSLRQFYAVLKEFIIAEAKL